MIWIDMIRISKTAQEAKSKQRYFFALDDILVLKITETTWNDNYETMTMSVILYRMSLQEDLHIFAFGSVAARLCFEVYINPDTIARALPVGLLSNFGWTYSQYVSQLLFLFLHILNILNCPCLDDTYKKWFDQYEIKHYLDLWKDIAHLEWGDFPLLQEHILRYYFASSFTPGKDKGFESVWTRNRRVFGCTQQQKRAKKK